MKTVPIGPDTGFCGLVLCASASRSGTWQRICFRKTVLLRMGVLAGACLLAGCGSYAGSVDADTRQSMPEQTIEQVQAKHTDRWMAIPGVQGTAIGLSEGKPCILIMSSVNPDALREKIPSVVDGYPVVIRETGVFRALDP